MRAPAKRFVAEVFGGSPAMRPDLGAGGVYETCPFSSIDALCRSIYSGCRRMALKKIQVGQVWKKDDTGDSYLVTKVYNEALATFAVLRKAGSETEAPLRIRIAHVGASPSLPGFRFAQESEEF
jgi:hypothetical protein